MLLGKNHTLLGATRCDMQQKLLGRKCVSISWNSEIGRKSFEFGGAHTLKGVSVGDLLVRRVLGQVFNLPREFSVGIPPHTFHTLFIQVYRNGMYYF